MKTILATLALTLIIGSSAFAKDAKSPHGKMTMKEPTTEQRQKMATMHDKMATCLRSDKPVSDCRNEMMQGCEEAMGKGACPMMGHMHGMKKSKQH